MKKISSFPRTRESMLTIVKWIPACAGMTKAVGMTALVIFSSLLTACGFHLRGDYQPPQSFQKVYIEYAQPYDAFLRKLKDGLVHANVTMAKNAADAKYILQIQQIALNSSLQATSTTGQINAYKMQYVVAFSVLDPTGKVLLPSQSVQSSENYTLSSTQLLTSFNQQPSLVPFLQQEVIQQILLRLSGQDAQKALA